MNCEVTLIARLAQVQELDRLADLLGEIHDDTGEAVPDWLVHYIGGRREHLAAGIARLKAAEQHKQHPERLRYC